MSFRSYLRAIQHAPDHPQWRPQHLFIHDATGRLLIDHIARFERIESEFSLIAERIGLACAALPHSNKSSRKADYRDYYTPETRNLVSTIYRTDVERFGYEY
jgi:hypothetical protein